MADVSLVIPSRRGGAALLESIAAFAGEGGPALEIVVSECARDGTAERIRERWSAVRVLHFDDDRSVPQLRAAGLASAASPIVAMTEDACLPRPGWFAALRRAYADGPDAVGGAIEHGSPERLVDWAVFFCEYGRYLAPLAAEPRSDLPGQNVSYSRAALAMIDDLVKRGTWEPLWHWRLAARGARLVRDGSIVVVMKKRYTVWGFVGERFMYGRSFAAQRVEGGSVARRALFTIGCAVLPAVVLARIVRDLVAKRRYVPQLVLSLPYLAIFACVWAAGEAVGYATGSGRSASRQV